MADEDHLGAIIKSRESITDTTLLDAYGPTPKPIVIRVDGHCFHTFVKGFDQPWDQVITEAMELTAEDLLKEFSDGTVCYTQV